MNPLLKFTNRCFHRPNLVSMAPMIHPLRGTRFNASTLTDAEVFDQIADINKRQKFRSVFDALILDPRVRMPFDEYENLCEMNGLEGKEPEELSASLHTSGLIWCYPGSFENRLPLVLKPREAMKAFHNILDLSNDNTETFVAHRLDRLRELLSEIAPLEKVHVEIESKSSTHARRMWGLFGVYVVFHCGMVPYLTFWRLSWDIMEPVTYMFNVWTLGLATWFFLGTNKDFTYDGISEVMVNSKRQRLYKKLNFDAQLYNSLRQEITEVTDDLVNPEWAMLKHVHPKMPDYAVYDRYDDIDDIIKDIESTFNVTVTQGSEASENRAEVA